MLTHWTVGVDSSSPEGGFTKGITNPRSLRYSPEFLSKYKSVSNTLLEKANEKKVGVRWALDD